MLFDSILKYRCYKDIITWYKWKPFYKANEIYTPKRLLNENPRRKYNDCKHTVFKKKSYEK